MSTEPPLGLIPRAVHDHNREQDLYAAMARYLRADKDVPNEWIDEVAELAYRRLLLEEMNT